MAAEHPMSRISHTGMRRHAEQSAKAAKHPQAAASREPAPQAAPPHPDFHHHVAVGARVLADAYNRGDLESHLPEVPRPEQPRAAWTLDCATRQRDG